MTEGTNSEQKDQTTKHLDAVKLFTDGGSRGNPGASACAYVIWDLSDNVVEKFGYYVGITTNNQAEYQALRRGLERVRELGAQDVSVFMDSLLVVNQVKGIFKVKNRDLWPIYQDTLTLAGHFKKFSISHVPRNQNKEADGEVNRILDEQAGS